MRVEALFNKVNCLQKTMQKHAYLYTKVVDKLIVMLIKIRASTKREKKGQLGISVLHM